MKTEMTEKAYIIATDLAKIRNIIILLRDVVPSVNEFVDEDEYKIVSSTLYKWSHKLENAFECVGLTKRAPDALPCGHAVTMLDHYDNSCLVCAILAKRR